MGAKVSWELSYFLLRTLWDDRGVGPSGPKRRAEWHVAGRGILPGGNSQHQQQTCQRVGKLHSCLAREENSKFELSNTWNSKDRLIWLSFIHTYIFFLLFSIKCLVYSLYKMTFNFFNLNQVRIVDYLNSNSIQFDYTLINLGLVNNQHILLFFFFNNVIQQLSFSEKR